MSDIDGDFELVSAASIVRIECPAQAAELGRRLASRPAPLVSPHGDHADPSQIAEALLRGELVLVRRSPPELDDYDGSFARPLRDLAATGS